MMRTPVPVATLLLRAFFVRDQVDLRTMELRMLKAECAAQERMWQDRKALEDESRGAFVAAQAKLVEFERSAHVTGGASTSSPTGAGFSPASGPGVPGMPGSTARGARGPAMSLTEEQYVDGLRAQALPQLRRTYDAMDAHMADGGGSGAGQWGGRLSGAELAGGGSGEMGGSGDGLQATTFTDIALES